MRFCVVCTYILRGSCTSTRYITAIFRFRKTLPQYRMPYLLLRTLKSLDQKQQNNSGFRYSSSGWGRTHKQQAQVKGSATMNIPVGGSTDLV